MTTAPAPVRTGVATVPTAAVESGPTVRSNRSGRVLGGMRVLYIGDPVTGKTTNMLTWPGLVMLQFDVERATLDGAASVVPVIDVSTWDRWQAAKPIVRSRERLLKLVRETPGFENYQVRGLGVDSWTGLAEMAQVRAMADCGGDTQSGYGKLLNHCQEAASVLFSVTDQGRGEPLYLVAAVHEKEKMRSETVEHGGRKERVEVLKGVRPSINGSFGDNFMKHWGAVLWTIKAVPATADGGLIRGKQPRFYCRTDQIDAFRCGFDRWGKLPAEVAGDFSTLAKYWFPEGVK